MLPFGRQGGNQEHQQRLLSVWIVIVQTDFLHGSALCGRSQPARVKTAKKIVTFLFSFPCNVQEFHREIPICTETRSRIYKEIRRKKLAVWRG